MSRFITSTIAFGLLTSAAVATAKPKSEEVLIAGVHAAGAAMTAQGQGQGQGKDKGPSPQVKPGSDDHDQGDDHASDKAKLKVCNHDNPSATHSAICPQPNSPP